MRSRKSRTVGRGALALSRRSGWRRGEAARGDLAVAQPGIAHVVHGIGEAAAAGMALLLPGAIIAHQKAADSARETAPALLALLLTLAYLTIALTG